MYPERFGTPVLRRTPHTWSVDHPLGCGLHGGFCVGSRRASLPRDSSALTVSVRPGPPTALRRQGPTQTYVLNLTQFVALRPSSWPFRSCTDVAEGGSPAPGSGSVDLRLTGDCLLSEWPTGCRQAEDSEEDPGDTCRTTLEPNCPDRVSDKSLLEEGTG